VCGRLEYRDAIMLAQTSRYLRGVVRPVEWTSVRSRYLFVRGKEGYQRREWCCGGVVTVAFGLRTR
jgi:hypothetical protein